jgi:hypothetical protein
MAAADDFELHFAHLCEPLNEVRPIFNEFCAAHAFVYVPKLALGRYPRIRITKPGRWQRGTNELYYDLWIDEDENGNRFEEFRPDLPYSLYAGSFVDLDDDAGVTRYGMSLTCFTQRPFHQVPSLLHDELERHLPTLETWDIPYLKNHGRSHQIRTKQ